MQDQMKFSLKMADLNLNFMNKMRLSLRKSQSTRVDDKLPIEDKKPLLVEDIKPLSNARVGANMRFSGVAVLALHMMELKRVGKMNAAQKVWHYLKDILLKLLFSIGSGVCVGVALRYILESPITERYLSFVQFPGDMFKNLLYCLVIPLVITSLISAITSIKKHDVQHLGIVTAIYFTSTTLMATLTGMVVAVVLRPGCIERERAPHRKGMLSNDVILNLVRQLFPSNIIEACFRSRYVNMIRVEKNLTASEMVLLRTNNSIHIEYVKEIKYEGINMLGLIMCSVATGIAILKLKEKGEPLKEFIGAMFEALVDIMNVVLIYAPVGVACIIAHKVASMKEPEHMFKKYGYFLVTFFISLCIHGLGTLPALYYVVTKKSPTSFIGGLIQAIFTTMATASNTATLPVTMKNLLMFNHVDRQILSFIVPIGSVVNMDGQAVFQTVSIVFIVQLNGVDVDVFKTTTIILLSVAFSAGHGTLPHGGTLAVISMLNAIGLSTDDVVILFAFDWILHRFYTIVNMLGYAFGAAIIEKIVAETRKHTVVNEHISSTNNQEHGVLREFTNVWFNIQANIKTEQSKLKKLRNITLANRLALFQTQRTMAKRKEPPKEPSIEYEKPIEYENTVEYNNQLTSVEGSIKGTSPYNDSEVDGFTSPIYKKECTSNTSKSSRVTVMTNSTYYRHGKVRHDPR